MDKIRTHLLATAAVVALSSAAYAADMGMPLKAPPPPPPPVQDWSGIYVGLEGGYGWGHENASGTEPWAANPVDLIKNGTCTPLGPGSCSGAPFEAALAYVLLGISPGFPNTNIGSTSTSGWLGGGFFGAQKQWGNWVLGLEADADGADIQGSSTFTTSTSRSFGASGIFTPNTTGNDPITATNRAALNSEIDMLGSVRGKVGYAFSPNWMVYGTGGLGFAHKTDNLSNTDSIKFCDEGYFGSSGGCTFGNGTTPGDVVTSAVSRVADSGTTMFGWTAGAGLDYKWQIDPGSAVIFGVEYLHYGFGQHSVTFSTTSPGGFGFLGTPGNTFSMTTRDSVDVVKARISYLFSIH